MIDLPGEVDDGVVAFDTETSRLHPDDGGRVAVVSVAWTRDGVVEGQAFPFDQGFDPTKDAWFDRYGGSLGRAAKKQAKGQMGMAFESRDAANLGAEEWRTLLEWLQDFRLVAHNSSFDLLHMLYGTRFWKGRDLRDRVVWDTMLAEAKLSPLGPIGLKETASRIWGDQMADEQHELKRFLGPKEDPRYDLVPWSVMEPYALADALMTVRLRNHQLEELEDPTMRWLHPHIEHANRVALLIHGMQTRGIGYDVPSAEKALKSAEKQLELLKRELPFKATVSAARYWFYDKHGAIPHCMTEKSGPSVGQCCVRTLLSQEIPGAKEWAQYQKVDRAISAWYTGFLDKVGKDGRLRTNFRQTGTVTGRWSSQRVNLQALPHDYRLEV
jgi:DNA polymerase I-like protein with 3'-5' exonuclease and polymerase domains